MRELVGRSDLAREFVLQILGLRPEGDIETDEELQRKLALVRAAHGHESRTVRAIFASLEDALEEFAAEGPGEA